jgi:hypothetical protein
LANIRLYRSELRHHDPLANRAEVAMKLRKSIAARNRATLTVLAVGLLALPSASVAAPQPPRPTQDSVRGSGVALFCGSDGQVVINAQSGPSGENPTGEMRCGELFGGPVTCLSVTGNVALLITGSRLFGPVAVRVTDNGTSDRLEAAPVAPGHGCPTPVPFYSNFPFTGDLVVVDAPPSPTSKDQCKNGGYAQYGFTNHGQCVAFVQRGPDP